MRDDMCDIVLHGQAGGSVVNLFAVARGLAAQTGRDITVEGNGVRVVVTPQMDEDACRVAYTRAIREPEPEQAPDEGLPQSSKLLASKPEVEYDFNRVRRTPVRGDSGRIPNGENIGPPVGERRILNTSPWGHRTEAERRSYEVYTYILGNINVMYEDLTNLVLALGKWHAQHRDTELRSIAETAKGVAAAADRVQKVAAEQAERP